MDNHNIELETIGKNIEMEHKLGDCGITLDMVVPFYIADS
jgi:hypothetical protein